MRPPQYRDILTSPQGQTGYVLEVRQDRARIAVTGVTEDGVKFEQWIWVNWKDCVPYVGPSGEAA